MKLKESAEYADNLSKTGRIKQIVPDKALYTNIFTNSVEGIILDYRNGLEAGMNFVHKETKRN